VHAIDEPDASRARYLRAEGIAAAAGVGRTIAASTRPATSASCACHTFPASTDADVCQVPELPETRQPEAVQPALMQWNGRGVQTPAICERGGVVSLMRSTPGQGSADAGSGREGRMGHLCAIIEKIGGRTPRIHGPKRRSSRPASECPSIVRVIAGHVARPHEPRRCTATT